MDATSWGVVVTVAIAVGGIRYLLQLSERDDAPVHWFDVGWCTGFVVLMGLYAFGADLGPSAAAAAIAAVIAALGARILFRKRRTP